ncbi:hypothetical protein BS50DRAFT_578742 [Corynespora cassiicola Philippines]|uniref:BZIP domain-containing protein n=1 Tax=Corynespora cassiicola Philippines TaxID=1448308 RepID=A0A2T2N6B1_CORCC|nr:hypothetical protein BS50DRAFT_578742 [Corynespora cassiicola Philippines]
MSSSASPPPKPGRRSRQQRENPECGQKRPKKANSEVRKQQNRIASRNYREKRKRKLQYLQQLIRDGRTEELTLQDSGAQDRRTRSLSVDYSRPLLPGFSHNHEGLNIQSSSAGTLEPALVSTGNYSVHQLPPSHSFTSFETAWSIPVLEPANVANWSPWSTPAWMSSTEFEPQITIEPETFPFTATPVTQMYQQLPKPPQQPQELIPNADLFVLGPYPSRRDGRTQIPSMSLHPRSPYHHHAPYTQTP